MSTVIRLYEVYTFSVLDDATSYFSGYNDLPCSLSLLRPDDQLCVSMTVPDLDSVDSWQYNLPSELIASRPTARRDESRMLLVDTQNEAIGHHSIRELPDLLQPGDRLVSNDTQVLPARLFGFRTSTGGKWEGLFLAEEPDGRWRITGQTRGKLTAGEEISVRHASEKSAGVKTGHDSEDILRLSLDVRADDGTWIVSHDSEEDTLNLLTRYGTLPLPPYIGRKVADDQDRERYQTVFASEPGAIAAPTAGLHFTDELLTACGQRGIEHSSVTLHVGIGTFRPVATERLSDHRMHSEWCRVSQQTVDEVHTTRSAGGRIVSVGTTSVRTLESASQNGQLSSWTGPTDLFIRPGFQFQTVDALLTNFHLPGSTLIVLVASLAGYDLIMEAYRIAVASRYRFYSYGDAMLII